MGSTSRLYQVDFAAQRLDVIAQHDRFDAVGILFAQGERELVGMVERGAKLGEPAGALDGAVERGRQVVHRILN